MGTVPQIDQGQQKWWCPWSANSAMITTQIQNDATGPQTVTMNSSAEELTDNGIHWLEEEAEHA